MEYMRNRDTIVERRVSNALVKVCSYAFKAQDVNEDLRCVNDEGENASVRWSL